MQVRRPAPRVFGRLALLGLLALASACAAPVSVPTDFANATTAAEQAAPVGGAALHLRHERLQRIFKDLVHLRTSLISVRHRDDRESQAQLARFAGAYMYLYLDPLLAAEWQSRHPELMALDAGLRLAEIDLLREMREGSKAEHVLADLQQRYAGREDMLVDYPVGAQSPLGEAVKRLRDRNGG